MLSRAVENSGTVTSVLVPWNTCGAYISGVLGVATVAYFPFCFFSILSPILAVLFGFIGFKVPAASHGGGGGRTRSRRPAPQTSRDTCEGGDTMADQQAATEPASAEEAAAVHASLGVHDPVRADRAGGDRDLDRPGRHLRPGRGGRPGPRDLPRDRLEPAADPVDSIKAPINGLYGVEDDKGNIDFYNSGDLFGAIDVALFIIVIGGFLGITMKTGAIQAGIGRLVAAAAGPGALDDPDPDGRSSRSAARPTGWPRRAWPSTPWSSR